MTRLAENFQKYTPRSSKDVYVLVRSTYRFAIELQNTCGKYQLSLEVSIYARDNKFAMKYPKHLGFAGSLFHLLVLSLVLSLQLLLGSDDSVLVQGKKHIPCLDISLSICKD